MKIDIKVKISENLANFLNTPLNRKEIENMVLEIDKLKFGESGNLKKSINNQSSPDEMWKPLSEKYLEWKKRMLGQEIKNEPIPPKTVIDTKIWVRTGKALIFTESAGTHSKFKQAEINYKGLYSKGVPLYQVFVNKIDYIKYANEKRPLIEWYAEDVEKIKEIFDKIIGQVKSRFQKATGGKYKDIFEVAVIGK